MVKHLGNVRAGAWIGAVLAAMFAACAPAPEKQAAVPREADAPRLVVLVVLDQFGSWVLDRHLPSLPADGAIRSAWENGARHTVAYPYANTATAAGHTTLVTGLTPAGHGVMSNDVYDATLGRSRKTVDDRTHSVLGNARRYASPVMLKARTVGDALHDATDGAAVIVGLSVKARSAVLSAGRAADLVLFYDDKLRGMTTTSYYAPSGVLPEWVQRFNRQQPVDDYLETWRLDEESPECARDAVPGEGPFKGWDASFPHDPRETTMPYDTFTYTPASTRYLFAAAGQAVESMRLGADVVPDFLVLSVSGTDLVGHVWGPESCEFIDNLLETDRLLTEFSRNLESRFPVSFVLTADHGVSPLPETVDRQGGRLAKADILAAAKQAALATLGEGDWVADYVAATITFTLAGKSRRDELMPAVRAAVGRLEGIHAVYDVAEMVALRASPNVTERLVGESLHADTDADLFVVPEPYWFDEMSDVPGGGASHGTPWDYDRRVPVLMWGSGVGPSVGDRIGDARQVAATLAALLGIAAPEGALGPPLSGLVPGQ